MGRIVELGRRWELGDPLGAGGFASVFEATADDGSPAVVKLIPKTPGAKRELLFEDLKGARNVVPVLDTGEWNDHFVIVMPRAEKSLRQHIVESGGSMTLQEAVVVLREIVDALVDIADHVVHRDIKPENILLLADHWCLADFGIARYVEASTASDTRKGALSPPYAAPERWRAEHATTACDVYAVGIMAFEMLAGTRPFSGPQREDFRDQHLNQQAPLLTGVPPSMASVVAECLYKAPEARPSPSNLARRLATVLRPAPGAAARLQEANKVAVEREAAEGARASAARSEADRRTALLGDATTSIELLSATLLEAVHDAAPAVRSVPASGPTAWALRLNDATFLFGRIQPTPQQAWGTWRPAFQVIASCEVSVRIPRDSYDYEGRSHSLWYCDAQNAGTFRWFETAFMISPILARRGIFDPFALGPGDQAGKALAPGNHEFQVAWPFTPIDQGDDADFLEHWIEWFARAALGELEHPAGMPERVPDGSWRR